jgi:hypothetical protein
LKKKISNLDKKYIILDIVLPKIVFSHYVDRLFPEWNRARAFCLHPLVHSGHREKVWLFFHVAHLTEREKVGGEKTF